jgi:hypothetical protein
MKRSVLIIVALCATLLLAAVVPAAASTRHPFRGVWRGIDAFDGSNIAVTFVEQSLSGGQVFDIHGRDDRTGVWCGGPAEMRAIGVLEGEVSMAVSLVWWCLPDGSSSFYFLPDHFTYDPSTDTMTTDDGSVYHRGR